MFLAKRYCDRDDDSVYYKRFLEEIDLIDRGLNPLMTWAEDLAATIVKGINAKNTDFETIFKKFAPGKNYITESQFIEAMKDIGVTSKFDNQKLNKFYYFIDDDKSHRVEFREMEGIIKTHCTKTTQKLMDEILEEIKLQMNDNKIKVQDVYHAFDKYSRDNLINKQDFRRGLTRDLKFHIDDIDIDFAVEIYKDKKDKRSVRYSTFIDDLKQKFELTETYVVPGKVRKEPTRDKDPVYDRTLSRKDFATPTKGDDKLKKILKELRIEAHDRKIDLKQEFNRKHQDGILTEKEFKDVFYDCRLKMNDRDIVKLIDRYINTVGNTIDTNVLLEQMNEGGDTHRSYTHSSSKKISKVVNKDIITKIARKLDQKGITKKIIYNLEKEDKSKTQYISFDQIKEAFHQANFKLSTPQVKEMLAEIKQNKDDDYNYHHLLCELFGDDYKKEIKIDGKSTKKSGFSKPREEDSRHRTRDSPRSKSRGRDSQRSRRSSARSGRDSENRSRHGDRSKSRPTLEDDKSKSRRPDDDRSKSRHRDDDKSKSRHREDDKSKSRHRDDKSRNREDDKSRSRHRRDSKSRDRRHDDSNRSRSRHDTRSRGRREDSKHDNRRSRMDNVVRKNQDESRSKSRRNRTRAPVGKQAHAVGKRLLNTRYDYIDHLKHFAGEDKDYILTDDQVYKILKSANITLTKEEQEDFIRDMGGDTRFTIEDFLINCNLDVQAYGGEPAHLEITLTTEEKEQCEKILVKVGLAIEGEKKDFERIFNVGPYDKEIDFSEVKYGLMNELNDE